MKMFHRQVLTGAVIALALFGCTRTPSRIQAPALDPAAASKKAFELFDDNQDGFLDEEELGDSPSLKKAVFSKGVFSRPVGLIDENQDKKLSLDELTNRLKGMSTSRVGRMTVACSVARGNQRLSGVEVKFIPEPFMGDSFPTATGTTDVGGLARVAISEGEGMAFGFYRVELSRKNKAGKETIPARFNTETELGQEVSILAPEIREGVIVFQIAN